MASKMLFTVFITLCFLSCTKEENPETVACSQEKYDTAFSVEAGETYCFDDDTELKVVELKNEFCPCNVVCVSAGSMTLKMEWTLPSGEFVEGVETPDGYTIAYEMEDVTFIEPCTDAVPSPEITKALIVVTHL